MRKQKKELFKQLSTEKYMVLATSLNDKVTARSISHIILDEKIMFQTDLDFIKIKQMENNGNVALCINNIQIEGTAKIKGHPFDDCNKGFLNIFKVNQKSSFEKYSKMKNETVVEVVPTFITIWKYEEGKPIREFIDLVNCSSKREFYDTTS